MKRLFPSFILFIYKKDVVYTIVKGAARYIIEGKIIENFGLDVLERLFDDENIELKAIQERGVFGNLLLSDKFFKPNYKFSDEKDFGKFYRHVSTYMSKDKVKKYLGINTIKTSLSISGEASLKINNRVKIDELIERISLIDDLLKKKKTFFINDFFQLSTKELKSNKIILQSALNKQIFIELQNGLEVYIYHPNINEFIRCESLKIIFLKKEYEIEKNENLTLNQIVNHFKISLSSFDEFEKFLKKAKMLLNFEENKKFIFDEQIENCISGEGEIGEKRYFKFDGNWYQYNINFNNKINSKMKDIIAKSTIILDTWKTGNEGQYNSSFINKKNFIVADKALYKNIEICDFFQFDNDADKITFYHVKDGFGQNIRVVYNQIMNGVKMLWDIRNNNDVETKKELEKYFGEINSKQYKTQKLKISIDEFLKILRLKNVTFVLAYRCNNDKLKMDVQIIKSKSNIAKLSIAQCQKDLKSIYDVNFELTKV